MIMAQDMEDWSLQAIVRGSSGDYSKIVDINDMDGLDSSFDVSETCHHHQKFDLASFPEFFELPTGFRDELEELYKPFYPVAGSDPAKTTTVLDFQEQLPQEVSSEDKLGPGRSDHSSGAGLPSRVTAGYTPKYKRRKNQHKRVVIQVSAEGLASDMWAWRKYGQKPIKGSPYPRSYYRCSSLKGCLARKQVEQSCADPGMFIITYTAEHSHSQPTRRNCLAGTVRQKFPSRAKSPTSRRVKQETTDQESTSSGSPKTPQQVSSTEVAFAGARVKEENCREETEARGKGESPESYDDFIMSDFVFNEDFFSGFEDFDGIFTDLPVCQNSAQQFPVRSCT
ncbi:probable WRKY transcription factor 29 [Sesamum indicum]|uniref:Probable WRKY transcription factor 29 n=1 Tax=Sesamum indicum TaxID=4182 RepID=A0A6I9TEC1_SESIN|nr:probable WRKY transcription factor 29 [Sesamum indicum]